MSGAAVVSDLSEALARKTWATMVATAAMHGFMLWRSDAADGPQRFFLGKWGHVRVMADLPEVERVLEQVGAQ